MEKIEQKTMMKFQHSHKFEGLKILEPKRTAVDFRYLRIDGKVAKRPHEAQNHFVLQICCKQSLAC